MKTLKIPLFFLILLTHNTLYSETLYFEEGQNLSEIINLQDDEKWSLNGGIFRSSSESILLERSGLNELLILDSNKKVRLINLIANSISKTQEVTSNFKIDQQAPKFEFDISPSTKNGNESFTIGSISKLKINSSAEDLNGLFYSINDDTSLIEYTNPINLDQSMNQLKITSVDIFENKNEKVIHLQHDFAGPEIQWTLGEPAIQNNNQWLAGKTSIAQISSQDPSGVSSLKIDGKNIQSNQKIQIKNNSVITSTDMLGNTSETKIAWKTDKEKPQLHVTILGQTFVNKKRFKLRVNQDVLIQAVDEGAGVEKSIFYGKKRRWENLPETFTFLSPGKYEIRTKSKDKFGNSSKTKLYFRVTK